MSSIEKQGWISIAEDGGELPTPKALGDLLVAAVREQRVSEKVSGKPLIVYLSEEGAKEIQSAGIDVDCATKAVTNITGVPVAIRFRPHPSDPHFTKKLSQFLNESKTQRKCLESRKINSNQR